MLVRVSSMRGTSHDLDLRLLHQALVPLKHVMPNAFVRVCNARV